MSHKKKARQGGTVSGLSKQVAGGALIVSSQTTEDHPQSAKPGGKHASRAKKMGIQQELFQSPAGKPPPLPPCGTRAHEVLRVLRDGPLNQIQWLEMKKGWRLAATVKELRYDGWPIETGRLYTAAGARIAKYRMTPKGLRWLSRAKLD